MIVGSFVQLEVGKIYHKLGIRDKDGIIHLAPFQVLREANFTEYHEHCVQDPGLGKIVNAPFFYEVSID